MPDLRDFKSENLEHRLLRGGLPRFFLAVAPLDLDFQEWMDAYWAKDIQELSRLERRYSFQRFAELLINLSSGIFEATRFTDECEASRSTTSNSLQVLEATFVVHIVRPFNTRRPTEIFSAPKVYAFDTGFVCHHRSWLKLRPDDLGILWEHLVLNELHGQLQSREIRYWPNKSGHEIDFVLTQRGAAPSVMECKWRASEFDASNLKAFRRACTTGKTFVVSHDVNRPYLRSYGYAEVEFVSLPDVIKKIRD